VSDTSESITTQNTSVTGCRHRCPAAWAPGRAHFRYDDLCRLADLLTRLDTPPSGERADRVLSKNPIDAANEGFPMKVDSGGAAEVADESASGRLSLSHPLQFLLIALAGWINQQRDVIDYLQEENRVLREQAADDPDG
jgi:hypothetical protein